MFRHKMCHPQGACSITLPNNVTTTAALVEINKVFKTIKLSDVIKRLLLHEICLVALNKMCNKYGIY